MSTAEQKVTVANLFQEAASSVQFGGANQLSKTAQLTAHATRLANELLQIVMSDVEQFEAHIKASQIDHDAMDDLIGLVLNLGAEDLEYLKEVDEEEIDKMIRSQQSKRSRAKSKLMTQENYKTLLVGAISENLLRLAAGKPKSSMGNSVMGDIGFSPEDLAELAKQPEELKKAIRNIQSKKSIMKSKSDFDPEHPRWKQLLEAEQQLKALRSSGSKALAEEAKKALEATEKLESLLGDMDVEELPPEEAAKLLASVKEMLASR